MSRALAPANPSIAKFAFRSEFLRSLFSRVEKGGKKRGLYPLRDSRNTRKHQTLNDAAAKVDPPAEIGAEALSKAS
jgi:hypothetical protein